MKLSIKDFFSKYDQICSFLGIWSPIQKKFLMENFIFCAVLFKTSETSNLAVTLSALRDYYHSCILRVFVIWYFAFCYSLLLYLGYTGLKCYLVITSSITFGYFIWNHDLLLLHKVQYLYHNHVYYFHFRLLT